MPERHQDTKVHKELIINELSLVFPIAIGISALVPLPTGRQVGGKKGLFGEPCRYSLCLNNKIFRYLIYIYQG
jgi:hypothetical protein